MARTIDITLDITLDITIDITIDITVLYNRPLRYLTESAVRHYLQYGTSRACEAALLAPCRLHLAVADMMMMEDSDKA